MDSENLVVKDKFTLNSFEIQDSQILNFEFYQEIQDDISCIICSKILCNPVMCVKCENAFCKNCIIGWKLKKDVCPLNCTPLEFKEISLSLKKLLNKVLVKCPNDCSVSLQDYFKHLQLCLEINKKISCWNCNSNVKYIDCSFKSYDEIKESFEIKIQKLKEDFEKLELNPLIDEIKNLKIKINQLIDENSLLHRQLDKNEGLINIELEQANLMDEGSKPNEIIVGKLPQFSMSLEYLELIEIFNYNIRNFVIFESNIVYMASHSNYSGSITLFTLNPDIKYLKEAKNSSDIFSLGKISRGFKDDLLVSGHENNEIKIWDATLNLLTLINGYEISNCFCSTKLNNHLNLLSGHHNGSILIYDIEAKSQTFLRNAHLSDVFCLATSDKYLISGGKDAIINIWSNDKNSYKSAGCLIGHSDNINCLLVLKSKSKIIEILISAGDDNLLILWSLNHLIQLTIFNQVAPIYSLIGLFSFDSEEYKLPLILAGGKDKTLYLWNFTTKSKVKTFENIHNKSIFCLGKFEIGEKKYVVTNGIDNKQCLFREI